MFRIKTSPIKLRSPKSPNSKYKDMHNKAFPPSPSLKDYKAMHERACPSPKVSLKSYKKMHNLAFPSGGTRRTRRR